MGGRGSSMRGSQGMGGGTGAPAAAAQAMPTVRAAPAVQQAGPPTGATGFGHLTPQQVAAFENAAQQQMQRDPALAAGVVDYINPLFIDFAVFNFADILVCVGVALWVLVILLEEVEDKPSKER